MYDNPAYITLRQFAYIFLQLGKMGQKHEVKENVGITRQAGGMRWAYVILGDTFAPPEWGWRRGGGVLASRIGTDAGTKKKKKND